MRTGRAPERTSRRASFGLAVTVGLIGSMLGAPASGVPLTPSPSLASAPAANDITVEDTYPRVTVLDEPAPDDSDAAGLVGLTPFHQLAPVLNEAQSTSDRVSVEVVGRSAAGRDLYLVTLTAPDSDASSTSKVPVLLTANLHGDEREGTDAALALVQDFASSPDSEIEQVLQSTRVHILVCANPDGRVAGTRDNGLGFDLNRDLLTASQPEAQAVRDTIVALAPAMVLDVHGYANGPLIEPTTAPFAQNIEFDLVMKHSMPNALGIERAINDLGFGETDRLRPPQIPLRDWTRGWDGWAPIFTAQYAELHHATGQTIELPLQTNHEAEALTPEELRRRTDLNTKVARVAMESTISYAARHRDALLADQDEGTRRGVAGEPGRAAPLGRGVPFVDADADPDEPAPVAVEPFAYPRAYVIPTGMQQRSAPAADRLVDHLAAHGVQVEVADAPVSIHGTTYPRGSYVVDMHQPRRGLANALLSAGTDASSLMGTMYDISAWSLSALWGADVVAVPTTSGMQGPLLSASTRSGSWWTRPSLRPRESGDRASGSAPSTRGPWRLRLRDPVDVNALHALLEDGVALRFDAPTGSVIIPADAVTQVRETAQRFNVSILHTTAASTDQRSGVMLPRVRVAAAATDEETFALREMGFQVTPVDAEALNQGFDLSTVDTLMVSTGLDIDDLSKQGRGHLETFLGQGGGLVALRPAGLDLNEDLDLLPVHLNSGRGDANGVVAVTSPRTGFGRGASTTTFVNAPSWFTDLGDGVVVDQRYGAGSPLVSGHWRVTAGEHDGARDAAGQALMVHGVDTRGPTEGAAVALLGSDPLFRAHPKGQYALVALALLWTATAG
ncbi:MAG: M14 family zinc carboxypeptidase [Ornithinimicrobium sp.]